MSTGRDRDAGPEATGEQPPRWPGARPAVVTLVTIVVLGVLIGAGATFLPHLAPARAGTPGERQDAVSRATDFAIAYNTYDSTKLDSYQKRVGSLLTSDYADEFDKVTTGIFKALSQKKQTSGDASVLAAAVDSMDDDSAVVLVAVNARLENTDSNKPIPRHFRWRVELTSVDGTWKVSKYTSVSTDEAAPGSGASTPSTSPGTTPGTQNKDHK